MLQSNATLKPHGFLSIGALAALLLECSRAISAGAQPIEEEPLREVYARGGCRKRPKTANAAGGEGSPTADVENLASSHKPDLPPTDTRDASLVPLLLLACPHESSPSAAAVDKPQAEARRQARVEKQLNSRRMNNTKRVPEVRRLWLERPESQRTENHVLGFYGWLYQHRPELLPRKKRYGDSQYQGLFTFLRGLYAGERALSPGIVAPEAESIERLVRIIGRMPRAAAMVR
jgi:hypothetical protein